MPREYLVGHGKAKQWSIDCYEASDGPLIERRILQVDDLCIAEDIAKAFTKAAQDE